MGEITYYIAASLDGFIAHDDGSFGGFIWDDEVIADFFADLKSFSTVLMGRKTYEIGLSEGKTSPYPTMRQIVFSRTMSESPDEAVELVQDNMIEFVTSLKQEADQPIWLCGGADVASALMNSGLIDHVVIKLNPAVFGSGIPLLTNLNQQVNLSLQEAKTYDCGITFLRYDVLVLDNKS